MQDRNNQKNLWRLFINIQFIIVVLLSMFITACGSNPVKTTSNNQKIEKIEVVVKQDYKISASVKQQYEYAIEAMQAEDFMQAISLFEKITQKEPRASGPWVNMAIAYRKLDKLNEADKAAEKAVSLNPKNPYALNQAGIIKREIGEFEASQDLYKRALAEYPNYANAHLNLAILCDLYLQKIVCAKSHYLAYQEINKKDDKKIAAWVNDLSRRENKIK